MSQVCTDANGKKTYYNTLGQYHREDGPAIEYSDGDKEWYLNGRLHRIDGPAIECSNGSKLWYKNGKIHRLDGPAIEWDNGIKLWFIDGNDYTEEEFNKKCNLVSDNIMKVDADGNKIYLNKKGQYHREDGPAVESANGAKQWYINDKLHREDGPAIEYANGTKLWYQHDERHRLDGPACEWANGHKEWFINGQLHRLDGPAVEYDDGTKLWFIDGEEYTEKQYNKKLNLVSDNIMRVDFFGNKIYRNKDEQFHRTDGPAVEDAQGNKSWYINGQLHREDGPAIEATDGYKAWYIDGKRHRIDGPAVEFAQGDKSWWVNGEYYTEEEFNKKFNIITDKTVKTDIDNKVYVADNKIISNKTQDLIMKNTNVVLINHKRIDCNNTGLAISVENSGVDKTVFKLVNYMGTVIKESTSSKEVYSELKNVLKDGQITFGDRERTIHHRKEGTRNKLYSVTPAQSTYLNISWTNDFSYSSEKYPDIKFDNINQLRAHIVNKEHIFKLFNASEVSAKGFIDTGSSVLSCNLVDESGLAFTSKENSMNKESVMPQVVTNALLKIKSDPTVAVATNAIDTAAKMSVARQGSRVLATFVSSIATALLTKLGYEAYIPILDSDLGKAMLEMSSPFILHAAVTHGLIPFEKYNEYIETATRWSIDANTAHYTMKYSDQAMDMFQSFMTDPKMRENFGDILKLGVAMSKAEAGNSGMLEKLVMPNNFADFDALIKEDAIEIERVR